MTKKKNPVNYRAADDTLNKPIKNSLENEKELNKRIINRINNFTNKTKNTIINE